MATRAVRMHNYAHVLNYSVAAAQATTKGAFCRFAAADDEIQLDGGDAVDNLIGVAMNTVLSADTKRRCDVMHPGPIIPCVAGGTVTRGAKLKTESAGLVLDATAHDSDGVGNESTYGIGMQSGVSGDEVGVCLAFGNRGV